MQRTTLTLVHCGPGPTAPSDPGKLFWRVFLDWLAGASDDEAEQLERVLAGHAHHVRPLVDAVSDALRTPGDVLALPWSLLLDLALSGWQPEVPQDSRQQRA
jgi:hypothetical protein